ncbi:MAG: hypothetical protein KBC69_01220 [Candidatus Magasanikbacteria bacterium]|nr:hypothetical protein [Candidatus Magasanikbacteria bacterium]
MSETGSFSGQYDQEKGVGKKRQLEVLDDKAVLELIVDGEELFVPPLDTTVEDDGSLVQDVEVVVETEPSAEFTKQLEAERHDVLKKMGLVHSSDFGDEPTRP